MTPAARSWLARPELARLWDRLHERLQRNGIAIRGRVLIPDASHAEREALALLMGRAYPAGTITIALADLDERLRSTAAGCGVADAVTELRGQLTNRPAQRRIWSASGVSPWQCRWPRSSVSRSAGESNRASNCSNRCMVSMNIPGSGSKPISTPSRWA